MARSKILYSTSTLAAYRIAKRYYGDKHYVWCADSFGPGPVSRCYAGNPPTSTPRWRYRSIHDESKATDYHGPLILSTKTGMLKGADEKLRTGVITPAERDEIIYYISVAQLAEYKPLLYIMVYDDVQHLVKPVPVSLRAHPLSEEFIIEELPGDLFEALDLDDL